MKWCPLDKHSLHWNWPVGIRKVWGVLDPTSFVGMSSYTSHLLSFHYLSILFGCCILQLLTWWQVGHCGSLCGFFLMVVCRLLIYSLVGLVIFLYKLLKLSSLDQLLYLLFQISALVSIMTMVFVEAAVFLCISPLWGRAQRFGPFQC